MKKNLAVFLLMLLAMGGFWFFWLLGPSGSKTQISLEPAQALGQVLAEETARLLDNQGQLVIVMPDTQRLKMPGLAAELDAQYTSFKKALSERTRITIAATERISIDEMRLQEPGGDAWPAEDFLNLLQKYPVAEAIVSFVRLPVVAPESLEKNSAKVPKLVVICRSQLEVEGLGPLLHAKKISLVIAPRNAAAEGNPTQPSSAREWFEQNYVLLKP